jgi:hypothetical protein
MRSSGNIGGIERGDESDSGGTVLPPWKMRVKSPAPGALCGAAGGGGAGARGGSLRNSGAPSCAGAVAGRGGAGGTWPWNARVNSPGSDDWIGGGFAPTGRAAGGVGALSGGAGGMSTGRGGMGWAPRGGGATGGTGPVVGPPCGVGSAPNNFVKSPGAGIAASSAGRAGTTGGSAAPAPEISDGACGGALGGAGGGAVAARMGGGSGRGGSEPSFASLPSRGWPGTAPNSCVKSPGAPALGAGMGGIAPVAAPPAGTGAAAGGWRTGGGGGSGGRAGGPGAADGGGSVAPGTPSTGGSAPNRCVNSPSAGGGGAAAGGRVADAGAGRAGGGGGNVAEAGTGADRGSLGGGAEWDAGGIDALARGTGAPNSSVKPSTSGDVAGVSAARGAARAGPGGSEIPCSVNACSSQVRSPVKSSMNCVTITGTPSTSSSSSTNRGSCVRRVASSVRIHLSSSGVTESNRCTITTRRVRAFCARKLLAPSAASRLPSLYLVANSAAVISRPMALKGANRTPRAARGARRHRLPRRKSPSAQASQAARVTHRIAPPVIIVSIVKKETGPRNCFRAGELVVSVVCRFRAQGATGSRAARRATHSRSRAPRRISSIAHRASVGVP